jgi:hypothetical protein
MSETSPARRKVCARCGTAFDCGAGSGDCWCAHEPYRLPLTEAGAAEGCLCPACLRQAAAAGKVSPGG